MRSDVDQLPPAKQRELERVVQTLFEEFDEARSLATQVWKKKGRILKIILYGSYARGGWVDEPHTARGYQSDFDLLIIVNDRRLTDRVEYWAKAEERLNRELSITKTLKTPVNFIVHTLAEVNEGLTQGRFFFMDVARDGIAIYQSEDSKLAEPRPKTPDQALAMAKEYFEEWYPSAARFKKASDFLAAETDRARQLSISIKRRGASIIACFWFALSTRRTFTIWVSCARRPSAWIADLRTSGQRLDRARFEKLKDAYVKARYSKHYRIAEDELAWLTVRVEELGSVVKSICLERIEMLERNDAA